MTRHRTKERRRDRRGSSAVEFALVAPLLVTMVGGIADFGFAAWYKNVLANSVAQGARYASLAGAQKMATVPVQSAVKSIVQHDLSLPGTSVSVSPSSCRCVTTLTTPPSLIAVDCGLPCPDLTTAASFTTITASYTYSPMMPYYSGLTATAMTETVVVRLQ